MTYHPVVVHCQQRVLRSCHARAINGWLKGVLSGFIIFMVTRHFGGSPVMIILKLLLQFNCLVAISSLLDEKFLLHVLSNCILCCLGWPLAVMLLL